MKLKEFLLLSESDRQIVTVSLLIGEHYLTSDCLYVEEVLKNENLCAYEVVSMSTTSNGYIQIVIKRGVANA